MKRALCFAMMFVATVSFTQAQDTFQSQLNATTQIQAPCKGCKCGCTGDVLTCTCKCTKCKKGGCGNATSSGDTKKGGRTRRR